MPRTREVLMGYARRNLLELEQVMAEVKGVNAVGQSVVQLASSEGFAWDLLPNVMAEFRQRYPGIQFKLKVVGAQLASQMVADGEVDLSVTYSVAPVEGLNVPYRDAAPIFALMRSDHPLAGRKLPPAVAAFSDYLIAAIRQINVQQEMRSA